MNTGKGFKLGKQSKKGIKIPPGHSVGVTAYEALDFSRDTVRKLYPAGDLHGLLSPTTDLAREGIGALTTQVDVGYRGTLNWTLTNTSSQERRFVFQERLYRLSVFLLEEGESPEDVYQGHYQEKTGYVPSQRSGPPVGMKEAEWIDAHKEGGPEDLLEELIRSGYPWHVLGSRLKQIDQQFQTVTDEYAQIEQAIGELTADVKQIREGQDTTTSTVREILRDESNALQNRWLIGAGSIVFGVLGLWLTVSSNENFEVWFSDYSGWIGLTLMLGTVGMLYLLSRRK